jgi:hypothetical protein
MATVAPYDWFDIVMLSLILFALVILFVTIKSR